MFRHFTEDILQIYNTEKIRRSNTAYSSTQLEYSLDTTNALTTNAWWIDCQTYLCYKCSQSGKIQ